MEFRNKRFTDLYSGGGDSTKYGFPIAPTPYARKTYLSENNAYRNRPVRYPAGC